MSLNQVRHSWIASVSSGFRPRNFPLELFKMKPSVLASWRGWRRRKFTCHGVELLLLSEPRGVRPQPINIVVGGEGQKLHSHFVLDLASPVQCAYLIVPSSQ